MLESLLASLECWVSEVSRVQANNHDGFGRYPSKSGEVSEVSDRSATAKADTPDTPGNLAGVSTKPRANACLHP